MPLSVHHHHHSYLCCCYLLLLLLLLLLRRRPSCTAQPPPPPPHLVESFNATFVVVKAVEIRLLDCDVTRPGSPRLGLRSCVHSILLRILYGSCLFLLYVHFVFCCVHTVFTLAQLLTEHGLHKLQRKHHFPDREQPGSVPIFDLCTPKLGNLGSTPLHLLFMTAGLLGPMPDWAHLVASTLPSDSADPMFDASYWAGFRFPDSFCCCFSEAN
jgi:hypothetical protein